MGLVTMWTVFLTDHPTLGRVYLGAAGILELFTSMEYQVNIFLSYETVPGINFSNEYRYLVPGIKNGSCEFGKSARYTRYSIPIFAICVIRLSLCWHALLSVGCNVNVDVAMPCRAPAVDCCGLSYVQASDYCVESVYLIPRKSRQRCLRWIYVRTWYRHLLYQVRNIRYRIRCQVPGTLSAVTGRQNSDETFFNSVITIISIHILLTRPAHSTPAVTRHPTVHAISSCQV